MEKEKQNALEMGKEKAQKAQEEDEKESRRPLDEKRGIWPSGRLLESNLILTNHILLTRNYYSGE